MYSPGCPNRGSHGNDGCPGLKVKVGCVCEGRVRGRWCKSSLREAGGRCSLVWALTHLFSVLKPIFGTCLIFLGTHVTLFLGIYVCPPKKNLVPAMWAKIKLTITWHSPHDNHNCKSKLRGKSITCCFDLVWQMNLSRSSNSSYNKISNTNNSNNTRRNNFWRSVNNAEGMSAFWFVYQVSLPQTSVFHGHFRIIVFSFLLQMQAQVLFSISFFSGFRVLVFLAVRPMMNELLVF